MRYLQIDSTVATGELDTSSPVDPSIVPAGRVMVDITRVTDPNAVIGCTVSGLPVGSAVVDGTTAGIMYTAPAPPAKIHVTKVQFFKSFTADEWAAFRSAMATDHELAYAYDLLINTAPLLDISDSTFTSLLQYCVTVNVITQARHDAIVSQLQSEAA